MGGRTAETFLQSCHFMKLINGSTVEEEFSFCLQLLELFSKRILHRKCLLFLSYNEILIFMNNWAVYLLILIDLCLLFWMYKKCMVKVSAHDEKKYPTAIVTINVVYMNKIIFKWKYWLVTLGIVAVCACSKDTEFQSCKI